ARRWSLARDDVRLAHESAFRTVSPAERGVHRRRLLAFVGFVDCALRESTLRNVGNYWTLREDASSAIRRLRADHVRLSASVADASYVGDVPDPVRDVPTSGPVGG